MVKQVPSKKASARRPENGAKEMLGSAYRSALREWGFTLPADAPFEVLRDCWCAYKDGALESREIPKGPIAIAIESADGFVIIGRLPKVETPKLRMLPPMERPHAHLRPELETWLPTFDEMMAAFPG